ncbi:MAG TPA: hypothetical protein VE326_13220 [Candidatus Binatia bacterium]|nr:hypothetical protein [Candidatus Binatia bacterium]
MMNLVRTDLRRIALVALALLFCWVATGVVHQHREDVTCEICKLLHSGTVAVGRPPDSPAPSERYERISSVTIEQPSAPSLSPTHVRGPPLG